VIPGNFTGNTCSFQTLPGSESDGAVSLAIVTGMKYKEFQNGPVIEPERTYKGPDEELGYPVILLQQIPMRKLCSLMSRAKEKIPVGSCLLR